VVECGPRGLCPLPPPLTHAALQDDGQGGIVVRAEPVLGLDELEGGRGNGSVGRRRAEESAGGGRTRGFAPATARACRRVVDRSASQPPRPLLPASVGRVRRGRPPSSAPPIARSLAHRFLAVRRPCRVDRRRRVRARQARRRRPGQGAGQHRGWRGRSGCVRRRICASTPRPRGGRPRQRRRHGAA